MSKQFSSSTEHIDVSYVANLARIKLTDEETNRFQGQIDEILAYVKELGSLDISNVEPMAHPLPMTNVFRADEIKDSMDRQKAIANAPASRNQQFLLPKIVE